MTVLHINGGWSRLPTERRHRERAYLTTCPLGCIYVLTFANHPRKAYYYSWMTIAVAWATSLRG